MESGSSPAEGVGIPESTLDLSFGFDDANYSDRTLLLQIIDTTDDDKRSNSMRNTKPITAPQERTIHISSLILAARSGFFHKLFSNGMQESGQKHATLRIEASEEISFMDLMKYVYSNILPTTFDALLDLLMVADKYEVASCLRDCTRSLLNLPMTCESATLYLDLSSSLVMSSSIQLLIDAAKQFLVAHFKELDKVNEEVLNLPLAGIQAVLSSDDLLVSSESDVYDLVLTWARRHYPELEERRKILKTHLLHLVRFPFMTTTKLIEEVQTCGDIDSEFASKIAFRALCFKTGFLHYRKHCLVADDEGDTASRQFVQRAYKCRPIKVIEFELPHQQCIVYFDLTREGLTHIFPEGRLRSETFHLGGLKLHLLVECSVFNNSDYLILSLNMEGSATHTFNYEIASRMRLSEEFERWVKETRTFPNPGTKHGFKWTDLMGDDSNYFINGILCVRAELTLKDD